MLEGALSFLGLGIPPPAPSWGNMIAAGQGILSAQPKFVLLPSVALFITVVSFNLLGESLRARWSSGERSTAGSAAAASSAPVATGPLLDVEDLRVDFRTGRPEVRAVDGLSYTVDAAQDAGAHRRVGLGQDGQLARDHGPAAGAPPRSPARSASRARSCVGPARARAAAHRGARHRDGLPGPRPIAEPDDARSARRSPRRSAPLDGDRRRGARTAPSS